MTIIRPPSRQPRPVTSKLVFEGVLFNVYQWEQELFDGTTRTFEQLTRTDASVVIPVTRDGHILVTFQEQPGREQYVALPGGHHDPGETPLEAAQRELLEEVGCTAPDWELYDALQPTSKADWAIYYFIARGCELNKEYIEDAGERIRVEKVNFDDFLQLARRPDFAERELKVHIYEALLEPAKMKLLREKILGR
jgi:8-oxo-dGTP pyrophosphatase MutT (NUDIX family)